MAAFNFIVAIAALSHLSPTASGNEAMSISTERMYKKVRIRLQDMVGMLQTMQQQVVKDGEDDADLFGKYMFYCRRGRAAIEAGIEEAAKENLEELTSTIEGEEKDREHMEKLIAEDEAKKKDAEKAIKKAKSIRDYEAVVYAEESSKLHADIASLKRAASAADKGEGLPQSVIFLLKQFSGSMDVQKSEREELASFVNRVNSGSESVPQQAETHKVLATLIEILKKKLSNLAEEEQTEKQGHLDYTEMVRHKANDLKTVIEQKEAQVEDLDSDMTSQKDTLEDASRYLMEGPAFLPFIKDQEDCIRREDEWADRCQIRTGELSTIAEALNYLMDDAVLEDTLKKSLLAPWQEPMHHALLASNQDKKGFDLISLALKGKNASFTKIFNVFDGMKAMLSNEQSNVDRAKEQQACGQSVNQTAEDLKRLSLTVSNLGKMIAQHEKSIVQFSTQVQEVHAGIEKNDQEVVAAAKVRKKEHEVYAELLAIDNVTLQLARSAKEGLSAYYSEDVPISVPGPTLGDIIGQYQKKQDESKSIIARLNATLTEVGAKFAHLEGKERQHQNQFGELVRTSLDKHASDVQSISEREGAKADLETLLVAMGKEKKQKVLEVTATAKVLSELQGNSTGFLRQSVCSRHPKIPKQMELTAKNFIIW